MPPPASRVLLRAGSVVSPAHPAATALLTVGDAVSWVGDEQGADSRARDVDTVVNLEGRLVTPGFVDAHVHLAKTGFALQNLDLGSATSRSDALDRLAARSAATPAGPLFAHGWDESRWPDGQPFTGRELERAVDGRVAYVSRVDSHSAVVSTALVALDPVVRTASGWRGDGIVERDAHHRARAVVDSLLDETQRSGALLTALQAAAAQGITSVHEANAPHISPYDDIELLQALRAEHAVPEVVSYWGALHGGDHPDAPVAGFAGDLCVDGALGSRTAALCAPYADADSAGHLYLDATQIRDHVVWCTRRGLQAGFHVIGDRALFEVADGLRAAADQVGVPALRAARHRLEHVEMPSPDVLATVADLGVVASVQPAFDAAWGRPGELYEQRLGSRRAHPMNPFGSMVRAGVVLAFGSDSPVTPLDPWGAVRAAVDQHDDDERLSVVAAFEAHTRGGHRARGNDAGGLLVPGADASYAVWDRGPDVVPSQPGALPDITNGPLPTCVRTVVSGAPAFDAAALSYEEPS